MTRVISVIGTAGGIGASILTAALATRASSMGAAVVAVDGRPFGGGLDVHFGVDEEPGLRWHDLADAAGTLDGAELFGRLPLAGRCGVLSFDRAHPVTPTAEAWRAVITALGRVSDIIVVDAPRAGEVCEEAVADITDDALLLTGTTIPALAGAAASAAHLDAVHGGVWLVSRVEKGQADLPESVAVSLDLPLLGSVPTDPRVTTCLSEGMPPPGKGALAKGVDHILATLQPLRRIA